MANNLSDIYTGVNKKDPNRNKNDLYRTPPIATYLLCKYSKPPKKIVEPCAGYGNIAVELIRNGHDVTCYDLNPYPESMVPIKTGQSVLDLPKVMGYDGLITNPPYNNDIPRKLVEKSVKEYNYTAMLLRLTFLEGIKRKYMFDANPPSHMIFFSDRIRFDSKHIESIEKKDQIGGMIAYAWFVFDNRVENTNIKWVCMSDEYEEWRTHYEA